MSPAREIVYKVGDNCLGIIKLGEKMGLLDLNRDLYSYNFSS